MRTLLTALILLGLLAGAALAADPTGKWKAEMQGPNGTMEMVFNLKADGAKLTGTMSTPMGEREITEGKVTGDDISFVMVFERDGNTMKIVYTGKVAGDEIKFVSQREGSDRKREFTAKKM